MGPRPSFAPPGCTLAAGGGRLITAMEAASTTSGVNSSGPNVSRSSSGPMTIAQIVGVANPQPMPTSDASNLPADYER